ncbi:hypothetical protein WJ973_07865 [Achromobacter xylosoxidans]
MLKFLVRVVIVVLVSLGLAYLFVDKGLGTLLKPMVQEVAFQSLRGQFHELHERLDAVPPAQRDSCCASRCSRITASRCGCCPRSRST